MWDATPVANDSVDTQGDMSVESPAAQAASFASGDLEAGAPPAIDAMSRNAETDVQAIADTAQSDAGPVSPGLFDALPPEDPAQAAAEAAAEAGEAEASDVEAGEVAQAPRQDAAQQDASHNA